MTDTILNQAELEALAYQDELTGLYNRRYLTTMLPEILEPLGSRSEPGSLMLIDVDHFKQINDTLGHAAGDHLLKSFADRMVEAVRHEDSVARVDLHQVTSNLARLGGDEFTVLLTNIHNAQDAARAARRLARRYW